MPDISQQLIERVKTALASKSPLNLQGNNTKTELGRQGCPDAAPLSVASHAGIVSYDPGELVLTARAGTTLADIDAALAENNQFLPSDPRRCGGQATIGGSLAANQSGPGRPWFGSLRDHVLGIRMINGRGEHLRFGGQVMKNVAGYDVPRLQAGAMGTLGIITEVSLKVLPQPDYQLTLKTEIDASDALVLMNRLSGSTKPLTGSSWVNGILYLRLQGSQNAVESSASLWRSELAMNLLPDGKASTFWQQLREHQLTWHDLNPNEPLWRFSVNPSAAHFLDDQAWLFDWSGAQRWLKGNFDLAALSKQAAQAQGEVQLYQGATDGQEIKLIDNPALRRIHKNVKASIDPQQLFNPSRLFSWL